MMQFNQTTRFILRNPDLLPLSDLFRKTPVNMTILDEGLEFTFGFSSCQCAQGYFKKFFFTMTTVAK